MLGKLAVMFNNMVDKMLYVMFSFGTGEEDSSGSIYCRQQLPLMVGVVPSAFLLKRFLVMHVTGSIVRSSSVTTSLGYFLFKVTTFTLVLWIGNCPWVDH